MLLSLLALGVALVVIGMERKALIYAWRTRPLSLPEGARAPSPSCSPVPDCPGDAAPSDSDSGYLATVDDEPPALYDWTFDDWRTTVEEIRGL